MVARLDSRTADFEAQFEALMARKRAAEDDVDGVVAEIITRADSDHIQASFGDIGSGPFAIAVFHDENENREFDTGFFGIPVEGYGFANDARVVFGPPSFEAASVVVNGEDAHITIRMTY